MSTLISQIVVPSNPVDLKTILDAVKEADDSMIRISAERDQIKAIIDDLNEKFPDLNKKYIRKLIKTYNKQNLDKEVSEFEDFTTLYEAVVK